MKTAINIILLCILSEFVLAQNLEAPKNLSAVYDTTKQIINLTWDASIDKVAGYNVFIKKANDKNFLLLGKAGLIGEAKYSFPVLGELGGNYAFKICAVQNFPEVFRSEFSNSVNINIPSQYLPLVELLDPEIKRRTVSISWLYDFDITDLLGFILLLNSKEIFVEKEHKNYLISNLGPGTYVLQIIAISETGLKSNLSYKKFIKIK